MDTRIRARTRSRERRGGGRDRHRLFGGARTLCCAAALVLVQSGAALAQHVVSGQVTALDTGAPLAGVQVQVSGTNVGTITDSQGQYALTAPAAEGTLVFSRIGYGSHEEEINGRGEIDVALEVGAAELEELVVIGYGEKTRAELTESVGVVSSTNIRKQTVASVDQAIQGQVSGAQISSQSGTPGSAVSVRIRGVGTIGNTQPLFVIDGVPVGRGDTPRTNPLAAINPADIESISVLKDASAAAMYGVQASNGVVLITTQRGSFGKPTIRYDAYQGFQRMPRFYDMLSTQEWHALLQEANDNYNAFRGLGPGDEGFAQLPSSIRPTNADGSANPNFNASLLDRQTDWQDVTTTQNAPVASHNLSVSGGTEQVNYYISGSYFQQDAIQQPWDLERLSFRANSDFQITDRVRFGETFTISNQEVARGHHNQGDGQVLANSLLASPIEIFKDPACASGGCPDNRFGYASNLDVFGNPHANQAAINQIVEIDERDTRILGGLHGEVDALPGLTLRIQGNLDYRVRKYNQWSPGYTNAEVGLDRPSPFAEDFTNEDYSIITTSTASYTNAFQRHSFNLLAGLETQQYNWYANEVRRQEFPLGTDPDVRQVVGGPGAIPSAAWEGERAFLSYLGRLSYDYDDRYLLTATVRRDGSSEFAPGHKWGTFPAVSAAWRIERERFFNVPWVNELRLRGSWGQLGNSSIPGGAYPHLLPIGLNSTYTLRGTEWTSDVPIPASRFPNADLTWESTTTTDFGVAGVLFDNTFDFSINYYDKSTGDFLLNVELPPSSGYENTPFNSGKVTNRGIELELGYDLPRFVDGLDLRVSGNLTTVRNRLVDLHPDLDALELPGDLSAVADQYRTSRGHPIGYFYGFKTCGIFQTQAEADQAPIDNSDAVEPGARPQAGDMCFVDTNGDGEIRNVDPGDDRTFIGSAIPNGYYGFNLTGSFRRFDFTAFFNGVYGVQKYNAVRDDLEQMAGGNDNMMASTRDRWTPENPGATMPRALANDPVGNARFSDRWIEDADYLRLRTLELGYTLPDGFLSTNSTRIYLSAQNVFTITGYSGYDPEFTTTIDHWRSRNELALADGTDRGNMPQTRVFQFGVSTSF